MRIAVWSLWACQGCSRVAAFGAADRAWLDLKPYPLPRLDQELALLSSATLQAFDASASRLAAGAVDAVFDTLARRWGAVRHLGWASYASSLCSMNLV
jgi:hypothetical protein